MNLDRACRDFVPVVVLRQIPAQSVVEKFWEEDPRRNAMTTPFSPSNRRRSLDCVHVSRVYMCVYVCTPI